MSKRKHIASDDAAEAYINLLNDIGNSKENAGIVASHIVNESVIKPFWKKENEKADKLLNLVPNLEIYYVSGEGTERVYPDS